MKKILAFFLVLIIIFFICNNLPLNELEEKEDERTKILLMVNDIEENESQTAYKALKTCESDFDIILSVQEINADTARLGEYLHGASDRNMYDVICVGDMSAQYVTEWLQDNSELYPDVKYVLFNAPQGRLNRQKNVQYLAYTQSEASFLSGALAAQTTQKDTLYFMGNLDDIETKDYLVGFISGVKYINNRLNVLVYDTKSNQNEENIKQSKRKINEIEPDICFLADYSEIDIAREVFLDVNIEYIVTSNSNRPLFLEELASCNTFIGEGLYKSVKDIVNDNFKASVKYNTLLSDGVGFSYNPEIAIKQEVKEHINILQNYILRGELIVPSVYEYTVEELEIIIYGEDEKQK